MKQYRDRYETKMRLLGVKEATAKSFRKAADAVRERSKPVLAVMLSAAMLLAMLPVISLPIQINAAEPGSAAVSFFRGGNGSQNTPYLISDAAELLLFANIVSGSSLDSTNFVPNAAACGRLMADIVLNEGDLSGYDGKGVNPWLGWTPIGSNSNAYIGVFDGNNHTVSGVYINNNDSFQGLFGYMGTDGVIENLGVVNSYVKGSFQIGGVCGKNYGGTIQNSYNTGVVRGEYWVGGICGGNGGEAAIINSYNVGVVGAGGANNVGGVCGLNNGTIKNSYNTGAVSGINVVGGICGLTNGTVENSYNIGTISGTETVGGICGSEFGEATIENSYYLQGTAGSGIGSGSIDQKQALTSSQMTGEAAKNNMTGFDFSSTWYIPDKSGRFQYYPQLKVFQNNSNAPLTDDVVKIYTKEELNAFRDRVNGSETALNARLMADIVLNEGDLSGYDGKGVNPWLGWTPIGSNSNAYIGVFDGNNHTVSGVYINNNDSFQGLFGYMGTDGVIENLGVVNSYVKGSFQIGGVCGKNYGGTIQNSYNTGVVRGEYWVGGICGGNGGEAAIINSYNVGVVGAGGANNVGGVCGLNNGTIKNSYNTGAVSGINVVGGICGLTNGTVENSYNIGAIGGTETVGGICGSNFDNATIENSYNTGAVSGINFVGGICGLTNGTVENSYYLQGTAESGIGSGSGAVIMKSKEAFASGEVAYLLGSAVFGQLLTGESPDTFPVFVPEDNGQRIYKMTFTDYANTENVAVSYANMGMYIPLPEVFNTDYAFRIDNGALEARPSAPAKDTAYTAVPAPIYTVTIPQTVHFDDASLESEGNCVVDATVSVDNVSWLFANQKTLHVTVVSKNGFKLKNGANNELPYTYESAEEKIFSSGDEVISLTGSSPISQDQNLSQSVIGKLRVSKSNLKFSGEYTDKLTFTVQLEDAL